MREVKEIQQCKNSLTGEHKWLERTGKNITKPEQCVLCKQLKCDLEGKLDTHQTTCNNSFKLNKEET